MRSGHCHPLTEDGYLIQNQGTAHRVEVGDARVLSICLPATIVSGETFEECLTPHDLDVHVAIAALIEALRSCNRHNSTLQAAQLMDSLVAARECSSQRFFLEPTSEDERSRQMRIAREFVLSRLAETISVGDIAEQCCFSSYHFHRLFASWHRMTPGQYIVTERIRRACRRLVLGDEPVHAISQRCGFASPTSFAGAFRAITGLSPRQFRQTHRKHRTRLGVFAANS